MDSKKLDISAISFDDMLGDGLETEVSAEDTSEDVVDNIEEEEVEDVEDEVYEDEEEEETEDNYVDEGSDEDLDVISEIAQTLGFEVDGEYDDSVDGLTNFVRDMGQQIAESQLQALFEQFPQVQKHLDYVMSGGNSAEFLQVYNPQTDFSAIEIDRDDVDIQRAVLGHYFISKGHDTDFVDEILDTLESNGKLYQKAHTAKEELAEYQEAQRQEIVRKQQAAFEAQKEQTLQFWDEVANTIEQGNVFAGVRIPDRQKARFFEYISEPIGPNGETQRDLDYAEAEIEAKLALDYLVFNGFNLNNIIETKAKTKSTESLREKILSSEQRIKNARGATRRNKEFNVDNLDMTALLNI